MLKTLALAAVLSLSTILSAGATTLQEAAAATFKLHDGTDGICSMTFVGNDENGAIFLTAAHCVDEPKSPDPKNTSPVEYKLNVRLLTVNDKFSVTDEEVHYLKVIRRLADDDTALVQAVNKEFALPIAPVEIASVEEADKMTFGQDLIVLGYPAAEEKSITKGNFTAKRAGVLDVKEQYQTTVPVAGGNSGGGLYTMFGDEYKLIGTTSAKRNDNEIMTYFSTAAGVKRTLAGFLNKGGSAAIKLDQVPTGRVDEK
jgi:S1-C subfamily serine protease